MWAHVSCRSRLVQHRRERYHGQTMWLSPRLLLVAALLIVASFFGYTREAQACGIKLAIKSPQAQRRSPNPTRVLIYKSPRGKTLQRALKRLGHKVEIAEDLDEVKRRRFPVIFADPSATVESSEASPFSVILPASRSVRRNMELLEETLRKMKRPANAQEIPTT